MGRARRSVLTGGGGASGCRPGCLVSLERGSVWCVLWVCVDVCLEEARRVVVERLLKLIAGVVLVASGGALKLSPPLQLHSEAEQGVCSRKHVVG